MRDLVRDLNRIYREEPAFWEVDFSHEGFRWIEPNDAMNNVLVFARVSKDGDAAGRVHREPRAGPARGLPRRAAASRRVDGAPEHRLGVLRRHRRREHGRGDAEETPWHDQPFSAVLTLPPLAVVWLQPALQS